jgi:hypothetical protein
MEIYISAYIIGSISALINFHWEDGLVVNKSFFVHFLCIVFSLVIFVISGIGYTNLTTQIIILFCSLIIVALSLTKDKKNKIGTLKEIDFYRVGLLYQVYVVSILNLIIILYLLNF